MCLACLDASDRVHRVKLFNRSDRLLTFLTKFSTAGRTQNFNL